MSDLQFVAFSDDGKMIILQTPSGEWIEVPYSPEAASLPRLASAAPSEPVELSPREIQARIRAGSSPAELALATGFPLERIMAFAPPILLERSHVATRAARTTVRRAGGSGALGDVVQARLEPLGVDPLDLEWDAYRREDGRWQVTLRYPSKEGVRNAAWMFDVRNNALVAADDEARWLTGDVSKPGEPPIDQNQRATIAVPYLKPVPPITEATPLATELAETELEANVEPDAEVPPAPEEPAPVEDEISQGSLFDQMTRDEPTSKRPRIPSWDEILFGAAPESER